MYQFAEPWIFLLAPLPALVYWMVPPSRPGGGALQVPFFDEVAAMGGEGRQGGKRLRLLWLILLWLLLLTAAARPQWLGEPGDIEISGRDLMLAVDVSGSMKAMDMVFERRPQDRLSAVKRVAGDFIQRRRGDRIGLILFGTRAYLQAPLSLDRDTVNQLLQESAIGIAGEKTAIGDAVGLALKRLKDRPGREKLLILLTDGANTAGEMDPRRAADLAKLADLRIHTIGVGSGDSTGLQGIFGGRLLGGRSDLDEATLTAIAEATGGRYFRALDAGTLEKIYALIDELEPVAQTESRFRPVAELFHWPLGAAVLLSLLWALARVLPSLHVHSRRDPAGSLQDG